MNSVPCCIDRSLDIQLVSSLGVADINRAYWHILLDLGVPGREKFKYRPDREIFQSAGEHALESVILEDQGNERLLDLELRDGLPGLQQRKNCEQELLVALGELFRVVRAQRVELLLAQLQVSAW